MCTVILLRRPNHDWPLLLAANRDEKLDRAWDPPGTYWPGHPGVAGGRDRSAGGSWMALGPHGVLAAVLNRPGSLGPAPGKRSRGELPLMAAEAAGAARAAERIAALPAAEWRPFNLVIADADRAFFLRGLGHGRAEAVELPEGLSMVTAHDPNDPASPRTMRHLPRFAASGAPADPGGGDWSPWDRLLADDGYDTSRAETLNVPPVNGFGTVCSSLAALRPAAAPIWLFCAGRPARAAFRPVV